MTDADLDDMAELLGDQQVMSYYPRPKTRPEARAWIEWNKQLYRDHGFGLWLITVTDTGAFVGDCGLTVQHVEGVDEIEIGYHVRTAYQGRGYATEAALRCRDLAREHFAVPRLIAIIHPDNQPSQRVAGKIGLSLEKLVATTGGDQLIYATDL